LESRARLNPLYMQSRVQIVRLKKGNDTAQAGLGTEVCLMGGPKADLNQSDGRTTQAS